MIHICLYAALGKLRNRCQVECGGQFKYARRSSAVFLVCTETKCVLQPEHKKPRTFPVVWSWSKTNPAGGVFLQKAHLFFWYLNWRSNSSSLVKPCLNFPVKLNCFFAYLSIACWARQRLVSRLIIVGSRSAKCSVPYTMPAKATLSPIFKLFLFRIACICISFHQMALFFNEFILLSLFLVNLTENAS